MTLIVAAIHDGDRVSIVSDTLITWEGDSPDEPEAHRLTKIVILRSDLAVGVTGHDPEARIRDLVSLRDAPVEQLLEELRQDRAAGFVVASLGPPALWEVRDGGVHPRTSHGVAWDGVNQDAYRADFRARFESEWSKTPLAQDVGFRLMATMQALTSFGLVPTVGGETVRVGADDDGFRFVADSGWIVGVRKWFIFSGRGLTRGASGILDVTQGRGRLYRHEHPDEAVVLLAETPEMFVELARGHGQDLTFSAMPWM